MRRSSSRTVRTGMVFSIRACGTLPSLTSWISRRGRSQRRNRRKLRTVNPEVTQAQLRHRYDALCASSNHLQIAAIVRLLPDGQTRTGRSPNCEHITVRTWFRSDPLQQIQNEWLDGVRQEPPLGGDAIT